MLALMFDMAIEQRENLKNVHMQDLVLSLVHHQPVCLQLLFPDSVTHLPLDVGNGFVWNE